jgi:hypothetical protein
MAVPKPVGWPASRSPTAALGSPSRAELRPIRGMRRIDRERLVAEFRDGSQDWLRATPRASALD